MFFFLSFFSLPPFVLLVLVCFVFLLLLLVLLFLLLLLLLHDRRIPFHHSELRFCCTGGIQEETWDPMEEGQGRHVALVIE